MAAAPDAAAGATVAGNAVDTAAEADALTAAPGICPTLLTVAALPVTAAADAPLAGSSAGVAGDAIAGRSNTLVDGARERSFDKYAKNSVHEKNTAAHTAVDRDKKLALPVAPNKLPEAPLPKDAPMSAPLPCCTSTKPIMASAARIWTATTTFDIRFMFITFQKTPTQPRGK
jgi:hypothetical protein